MRFDGSLGGSFGCGGEWLDLEWGVSMFFWWLGVKEARKWGVEDNF